jgi:hypothetical protein
VMSGDAGRPAHGRGLLAGLPSAPRTGARPRARGVRTSTWT